MFSIDLFQDMFISQSQDSKKYTPMVVKGKKFCEVQHFREFHFLFFVSLIHCFPLHYLHSF